MFRDASVLITGGTGSLGKALTRHLLTTDNPHKIVIYSRNEAHQEEMRDLFQNYSAKLRFILGSVTDPRRLRRATSGIDYIIHAAALKVVPLGEYNPLEFLDVNVDGTRNVIDACLESEVRRAIYIGTDKAVMPVNFYGFTKGTAERAWQEANYISPIFSSVRFGNIQGARGSAISKWIEARDNGATEFTLTHPECTRYWVEYPEAIKLIYRAFEEKPGLILTTKTKSYKVKDLIKAIYLRADIKVSGLREGEKVHETIVNEYEAQRANEFDDYYAIRPQYSFDDKILYDREHGKPMTKPAVSNDFLSLMTFDEVRAKLDEFRGIAGGYR